MCGRRWPSQGYVASSMNPNRAQRVVLVIGWGLILATMAAALSAELAPGLPEDAWFNYAPNSGVFYSGSPSGVSWGRALIWLAAIVLWMVGSLLLLRTARPTRRDPEAARSEAGP